MAVFNDALIDKLIPLAQSDPHIDILWLYGSQAKGLAHTASDIDLAVAFNTSLKDPLDRRLRPELLALAWCEQLGVMSEKVSIVDINNTPLPLQHAILRTGKALYIKSPLRLAKEENRISSMWELDYLYYQQRDKRNIDLG
ncbi:Nucleotidyltransferase domain-containing protein [Oceanospirillum multiglobuliferum]|uniref:Polymerase beta nucleotidyltransferase domain-containing protein n=1 Tax=Oceanospirillum multiglobuliferum TaxID=64969 RepID=A0A1T4SA11_9GAMM|nr:nucleotidyltransferase domain-containing protein [Oceanospirillum multiglobuliferum]OPX54374.1 hypothetical protein BTE48_14630 [Oceanospirillum multiglobuliferum]SKA24701.1 Nucleotidyltransferase domain-containing protein [Oceanospirillum multiglobuliferum]